MIIQFTRVARTTLAVMTSLLWFAFAGASLPAQTAPPSATIRINLREERALVSPTLYGLFLKEISHAFDGGIYAELRRQNLNPKPQHAFGARGMNFCTFHPRLHHLR